MGPRRFTRLQKAAALGPLFLLLLMASARDLLRCQFDGLLRGSCCCPAEKPAPGDDATPALKAQGCCDRIAGTAPQPAPAEARSQAAQGDAPVIHAVVGPEPLVAAPPSRAVLARHAHGPPSGRPPILLQKSALLI